MSTDLQAAIDLLARKITDSVDSNDALKYTQAALNLAHVAITLKSVNAQ